MPTIYNNHGFALPLNHYLYSRRPDNNYYRVATTYNYENLKWNHRSNIAFSESFDALLRKFAGDGCIVSKLLLKAKSYKIYLTEKPVNFISFRDKKGMISFSPHNKPVIVGQDGFWKKEGRQTAKPARFARNFLNPRLVKRLNDKHFNEFATRFKSYEESNNISIEETSFEEAYESKNFCFENNSCMRDKNVGPFYRKFDCVAIVGKNQNAKFVGRAILWNNVVLKEIATGEVIHTGKFLDRVYASPEHSLLFSEYARDNGYMHRGAGSYSGIVFDEKNYPCGNYYVEISPKEGEIIGDCSFYPYIDTFRWKDYNNDLLKSKYFEGCTRYVFDQTDGKLTDNKFSPGRIKTYDGIYAERENVIERDRRFYLKGGVYTKECFVENGQKEWVLYDDYNIITINEKHYIIGRSNLIKLCAHSDRWDLIDNMVKVYSPRGIERMVSKQYAGMYSTTPPRSELKKVDNPYKWSIDMSVYDTYACDKYNDPWYELSSHNII